MKKLLAFVLALSFLMSMSLVSAMADGEIQVGIVLPTKDEPRWIQDETRFAAILDQAGFTYQVLFSQGNSDHEGYESAHYLPA